MIYFFIKIISVIFLIFQPFSILLILLSSSLYLYLYKKYNHSTYINTDRSLFWHVPITNIAKLWQFISNLWHGYEIEGIENIPKDKPVLIIFYHAPAVVDFLFAAANIYLKTGRKIIPIVERSTSKIPGFGTWIEATESNTGTIDTCVNILNNNNILAIAPGGTREMVFSENYELVWGNRKGFAKVAIEAKVPIILVFTRNCSQIVKTIRIFKNFFRYLFEECKIPFQPIIGWFPVKLKTFISKPIDYDESRTVDELVQLTKEKMENFIKINQALPGNIFSAIAERFKSKSN